MKAFKITQLLAVTILLVSGSSMYAFFGRGCCRQREHVVATSCCPKASCATVKLPIEQVQFTKTITETCEQPPSIKYFVRKEIIPCASKNKERVECFTTCPKYEGTFDEETGERID
jgi:hypothetical protein